MKIRVVSSKDEIARLDPKEKAVHLVAPSTTFVLLELINRCPQLEAIEIHPSRFEKLSEPSLCFLKVQGVKIFPGVIQGHRTDMSEYFTVDDRAILQRVGEVRAESTPKAPVSTSKSTHKAPQSTPVKWERAPSQTLEAPVEAPPEHLL